MDQGEQKRYDDKVGAIMATLNQNYVAIRNHPFVRGRDGASPGQICNLLNRSIPVTETEKIIAATIRWISAQHRSGYIKHMFDGRYACTCQYIDARMIETGLNAEGKFSVELTRDGYAIGDARPRRSGSGRRPPPDRQGARGATT